MLKKLAFRCTETRSFLVLNPRIKRNYSAWQQPVNHAPIHVGTYPCETFGVKDGTECLRFCFLFFVFLCVSNRSFIGSKLEQTIIIVHIQYSVHTIKGKGIQNLYKTKHWRKKSYSSRGTVGKSSPPSACSWHSAPDRTDSAYQDSTDF